MRRKTLDKRKHRCMIMIAIACLLAASGTSMFTAPPDPGVKECKQGCNADAGGCFSDCDADLDDCVEDCRLSGGGGGCKKACRSVLKACKFECRVEKSECLAGCREPESPTDF